MNAFRLFLACIMFLSAQVGRSANFTVSPAGNDANPGTADRPFATLDRARQAVRTVVGRQPVIVTIKGGTYYLAATLAFTPEDSGSTNAPVLYQAAPGEEVVVSGGDRLQLQWEPHQAGIFKARTPENLRMDQLFVNGQRQHMARYPNFDPNQRVYNGYAPDAFSPQRAARWADPAGGYIHAMHRAHWGGYHYRITGKKPDNSVTYEGGWQNNRQMGMHKDHRYVENIFEELDAPGEWFHDAKAGMLYVFPLPDVDLRTATIELVRLRHLVEFQGEGPRRPVRFITLKGITFRHAARTFMDTREPLLRSDWTIYRGGAVLFKGAEDCALADCAFDQVGGNTVFVDNYNRRVAIRGCLIRDSGGNGVAFVGDPRAVRNPLFEYGQRQNFSAIDLAPGPQTDDYPADCVVEDCLITRIGRVEKQAAGVQISMSQSITVRHCSIYEVPRAGINLSEGTWGGHVIEGCDVFDTVLETGDHGSFNSWGRDRYWGLGNAPANELPRLALLDAVKPVILRRNRWRCDHGWDVDLDDGSSHYEIYDNLLLRGGLKLREGFHRRVYNNITVNNTFHPHVWYANSGDIVTNNIFMGAYRPAGGMPPGRWGSEIDRNLFATSDADRTRFAAHGCDLHSLVGDPLFVNSAEGDFRVKEGSPALRLGFRNFSMDQFGVQKPALKAIARRPEIPSLEKPEPAAAAVPRRPVWPVFWLQARLRELEGEEYSAFGVSRESGGVHLVDVPANSQAANCGFKTGDLIQSVNGQSVRRISDLCRLRDAAAGDPLSLGFVRAQQNRTVTVREYPFTVSESAADAASFKTVTLARDQGLLPIRAVTVQPQTANEPLATLCDGKLARNYGPVFQNHTGGGLYKVDLGAAQPVTAITTWSYGQNGNRGAQHFMLFGSAADRDPGWDVADPRAFMPIAPVRSACPDQFLATRMQAGAGKVLGTFRWLVWAVAPVTDVGENTAFQELQLSP